MEGNNVCLSQGRRKTEDMGMNKQFKIQDSRFKKDADIAFKRSLVYELLSHAFAEPSLEFIAFVSSDEFLDVLIDCINLYPLGNELNLNLSVDAMTDARRFEIETIENLYKMLISNEHSFLHECRYHNQFSAYDEMADISGFYKAFGLCLESERPDHISLELEFMRLLTIKEAGSLMDKNLNIDICINAQKEFLGSHLGRWIPLLSVVSEGIPFYGPISKFLKNWIDVECKYLLIKPDPINERIIREVQEDEGSMTCMIDTV